MPGLVRDHVAHRLTDEADPVARAGTATVQRLVGSLRDRQEDAVTGTGINAVVGLGHVRQG